MYKLYDIPSSQADIHELADFVEIECLKNEKVSKQEIMSALGRLEDDDYQEGNHIDNPLEGTLDDVYNELEYRKNRCGELYPFDLDNTGHMLQLDTKIDDSTFYLYKFLLLSTRLDMQSNRTHNNIDGTLLFEEVSEEIAKNYLGERSKAFRFGTSSQGKAFEDKVGHLCQELNEGGGFKNRNEKPPSYVKDDALDIVAWKPFNDNDGGKLIAFGQCKTGTSWKNSLAALQPDVFCDSWFEDPPYVSPIRLFFLTESLLRTGWYTTVKKAGILFDRCRIMDFSKKISRNVVNKVKQWSNAIDLDD